MKLKPDWSHLENAYRRRFVFPANMAHMAKLSRHFSLKTLADDRLAVCWEGEEVARIKHISLMAGTCSGRVWIVANGPSLAQLNLTSLHDEAFFGVNGAIVKLMQEGIVPEHYVITDPSFFKQRFNLVRNALGVGRKFYFTFHALDFICRQDPRLLREKDIYLYELVNYGYNEPVLEDAELQERLRKQDGLRVARPWRDYRVGYSTDCAKGVFGGRTVTFQAMQLAQYFGYQSMYVLGMDMGAQQGQARFYEGAGQPPRSSKLDRDFERIILPAFEVARQVWEDTGVQAFNVSPHSRMPHSVMPKVSFEDVLGSLPSIRMGK